MIRRRMSLTRIVELFLFGACPEGVRATRLSCMVAQRPCGC